MIPYGRQIIDEQDIDAVVETLRSPLITQGEKVPEFEESITRYCAVAHGVAVNSATSALHIACLALGLGPGDWLWTTPVSFVASANCGLYCGARVDFVDIDPTSYNLSPAALGQKLEAARKENRLPKVLVVVHLTGQPCEMSEIHALASQYGVKIIEDASHAIGARYQGEPVGNCRYSDITVFSFHPVKIITTAEGGLATTKDGELAGKMRMLRTHGVTRDPQLLEREDAPQWYYEQQLLGYNYRMTELQAALGLSQMSRLDEFLASRRALASHYDEALSDLPIVLPRQSANSLSSYHLYVVALDADKSAGDRDRMFDDLRKAGLGVNLHYYPIHLQPYYRRLGFAPGDFPQAESYARRALSIPMFAHMDENDRQYVVKALRLTAESR